MRTVEALRALGLAALLPFQLSGCSTAEGDAGAALAVDPAALYGQNCARCHGADGRGDPQMRLAMPVRDFSDPAFAPRATVEAIERVIASGRGQMPGFGGALSQPKIQALAGHVRRLMPKR